MTTAPRFEHTVGSHSDDRGGDADARCSCQDTTSSPDNTMEILEHYFTGEHYDEMNGTFIRIPFKKQMEKAKQSLDSHYLSIFLELVGEPEKGWDVERDIVATRNALRQELRTALQDRLGEKLDIDEMIDTLEKHRMT